MIILTIFTSKNYACLAFVLTFYLNMYRHPPNLQTSNEPRIAALNRRQNPQQLSVTVSVCSDLQLQRLWWPNSGFKTEYFIKGNIRVCVGGGGVCVCVCVSYINNLSWLYIEFTFYVRSLIYIYTKTRNQFEGTPL